MLVERLRGGGGDPDWIITVLFSQSLVFAQDQSDAFAAPPGMRLLRIAPGRDRSLRHAAFRRAIFAVPKVRLCGLALRRCADIASREWPAVYASADVTRRMARERDRDPFVSEMIA